MLRRVSCAYRQHFNHIVFGSLLGCSLIHSSLIRCVHQSISIQCSTPTHRASRNNSPSTQDILAEINLSIRRGFIQEPPELIKSNIGDQTLSGSQTFPLLSQELLSIIDSLFSHGIGHKDAIARLRESSLVSEYFLDRQKARKLAEAMTRTRDPQRSNQILILAHKFGCRFNQSAYECVAYHLAQMKHWHLIPFLVSVGKSHTRRTSVRLLNWLTRALSEMQNYTALEHILLNFEEASLRPTQRTFHLLISAYLRNRSLSKAKECIRAMEKAGFPILVTTHVAIASAYRSMGTDDQVQAQALNALPDLDKRPATAVLNSLLQIRVDAQDLDGIFRILLLFDQNQVNPSLIVPSGSNSTQDVAGNLTISKSYPCVPANATTFSILINYLAKHRDLPRALSILERMTAAGVDPDARTIASLISAHFLTGHSDTAVRLVAGMCDNRQTLVRLFRVLISGRNHAKLPLNTTEFPLNVEILNALLRGIIAIRGLPGANVVLHIMRVVNFRPNGVTIEIILSHLAKAERTRPRVLLLLFRFLRLPHIRPTLRHLHAILRIVLRHEKYLMHGSGWDVTAAKFSPRRRDHARYPMNHISGVADSFDPAAGIEFPHHVSHGSLIAPIVQSLASRGVKSDGATIALRIRHEAVTKMDLESAKKVFQTLLARGIHPNEYHFSALMEGYTQVGDMMNAERMIHSASQLGVTPNLVMFTILIVGYARQGNPDLAMRTFQTMVARGIKPDVPAIDAVSSAFFAVGAYAIAKQILTNMWSHTKPFPKELRGKSLKILARRFRSLYRNERDVQKGLTKQQNLILHRRLKSLKEVWKSFRKGSVSTIFYRNQDSLLKTRKKISSF